MRNKIGKKSLISSMALSMVLTSIAGTYNVKAASEVTRMPGADRFITASNVARQTFGKADNVILVNGLGYADAVSAAPLAKILNAPILLTDASKRPSLDLLETLGDLGAKKVYIIGGEGVVKKTLELELKKSYSVERIAGAVKDGRYGTNAEVAKRVLQKTGKNQGILVSAEGYADALSVASIAATKGYPVLFGNRCEIPKVVRQVSSPLKVSAVGGEGVLPETVLSSVNAERIAKGQDRFDTNIKVLDYFKKDLNFNNMFIAAGGDDSKYKFADALVASAAAAKYGSPVILNGLGTREESRNTANEYIKNNMTKDSKTTIIGGAASIDVFIESTLKNKAEQINKGIVNNNEEDNKKHENNNNEINKDNKVEDKNEENNQIIGTDDITAISLNQIKVRFDREVNKEEAENIMAYELDNKNIQQGQAEARLESDGKTVIITFVKPMKEGTIKLFKVKDNFIREKNIGRPVAEKKKKITFIDVKSPSVEKVEALEENKIHIVFSEGINFDSVNHMNNFKLDGKVLNKENSFIELLEEPIMIKNINNEDINIVNEIILNLKEEVSKGQHTVIFPIDNSLKVKDSSMLNLGKDLYTFNIK